MLRSIAELLHRDRHQIAQLEDRRTGRHFCRTRLDVTVATRYFESYVNTIGSFHGDTIPAFEGKSGSWRQSGTWNWKGERYE